MGAKALAAAVAATTMLLAGEAARAEKPAYTMADVTACSRDAIRLCQGSMGNIARIESCMRANMDKLHAACRARFDQAR